mmetsp:Transcript_23753/g.49711  ORF Transcript_23753/g.49711 Transcript_23753/m.49711 type:complete len:208 (-) Transcript_23753:239-862(-)
MESTCSLRTTFAVFPNLIVCYTVTVNKGLFCRPIRDMTKPISPFSRRISLLRFVLAIIRMNNFIQLLEARTPLQRNVCVEKLLVSCDVTRGINLKSVLVEESNHAGVGSSLLAGVVEWCAAASHSPGLIGTFCTPRKDVRTRIPVESLRKPTHHTLLDKIALLDRNSGERTVEHAGGLIGEGRLLHVDFGAVDFGFCVVRHGVDERR